MVVPELLFADSFVALLSNEKFTQELLTFLSLTIQGLGLGLIIGIPLGILLTRISRIASPMMSVLALIQTIPGLALLGFCFSLLGLTGATVAVTSAVVYSVFPVVLNTYTGIEQVDPALKDSARGMGMTQMQILWKVELPLALPVIMAGVRTGAVYVIGMITVCGVLGTGGLGEFITRGTSQTDTALIFLGVIPILIITMLFFWGLSGISRLSAKQPNLGLMLGGGLVAMMSLFAIGKPIVSEMLADPGTASSAVTSDIKQSTLAEAWDQADTFNQQARRFISLTMRGLGLALLVGLPMGIFLTRIPKLAQPLITGLALIQTIPSLALLGFCVSLFGLFGASAAIFGTVVYSLLPIVLNTYVGITQVTPSLKDSARGMGMTNGQILWKVEVPLALPVIMAGARTAATYAISMVTIATLVGARGLGDYVYSGMSSNENTVILIGVIPILILSFGVFWGLSLLAWLSQKRVVLGLRLCGALIIGLASYALLEPVLAKRPDIRIGCKNFTENRLMGEIMKVMIKEDPELRSLKVDLYPNLGSQFAYKSVQEGELDIYPAYDGTLLTKQDAVNVTDQKMKELKGQPPQAMTDYVREVMKDKHNLELLKTFGVNSTYVMALLKTNNRHHLKSIEDIGAHPELRIATPMEFKDRKDGWDSLAETYDVQDKSKSFAQFKDTLQLYAPEFRYQAVINGDADIVVGFVTDWQLEAYPFEMLKDNRNHFLNYYAAPLVSGEILERYPRLRVVLNKLEGKISGPDMGRMIREVRKDKKKPEDVARSFLKRKKLIP